MRRGVRLGVRSIEHGTSIDAPTAKIIADSETYVVSTLVVGDRALKFGREAGLSASSLGKLQEITNFGLQAFDHCVHAGTKIGFAPTCSACCTPSRTRSSHSGARRLPRSTS
jgi:hypothetical protein